MKEQSYTINGVEFRLRDPNDLSLEEDDEVNNIIRLSGQTVQLDNEQTKRFLQIVLERKEKSETQPDFRNCPVGTALEVVKHFFELRLSNAASLKKFFVGLTEKQN